ncbi:MAG TPA: Ig-like domain-containing protein [Cytophagales bacterium]|nr:Ig-like domain-containing protein [Cytophagales bacterium]
MKKVVLLFLFYTICLEAFSVTVTQKSWRWRNDDGSETSATLKADQNETAKVTSKDEVVRLRLEFSIYPDMGGMTDPKNSGELAYSTSPEGIFTPINSDSETENHFIYTASTHFVHGEATTQQMSPSSGEVFTSGKMFNGSGGAITFGVPDSESSRSVEHEWAIKPTEHAVYGTTYYFKLLPSATESFNYTEPLPSLTLEKAEITVTSIKRKDPTNSVTNNSIVTFEITMSEEVTGLSKANLEVTTTGITGAVISDFSGNGTTWEAEIETGEGDGTIRLDMTDIAGVSSVTTDGESGEGIPGESIPGEGTTIPFGVTSSSFPFTSGEVYTIDKTDPTVTISSTEANPTKANPIPVKIDFSEDVTGFDISDIVVDGGSKANFQGSGKAYTFDLTPTSDGGITVDIEEEIASDEAGNGNKSATQFSIEYSSTLGITVTSINRKEPAVALTNASTVTFEITLSAAVTGLTASNLVLSTAGVSGTSITDVTGSGTTWAATVNTGSGDGTIRLDMVNLSGATVEAPPVIEIPLPPFPFPDSFPYPYPLDVPASSFPYTSGEVYTIDKTDPTVTISSTEANPTKANPIPVKVDFSEDVTGFDISDIVVSGGSKANFQGSGKAYTFDLTPTSDGGITVDIEEEIASDEAGNGNKSATQFSIEYSSTLGITVTSINRKEPAVALTNASTVTFEITLSAAVTGLTASNLVLSTAGVSGTSITDVTGSGTTWAATVNTGSGDGTIRLDMVNLSGATAELPVIVVPIDPTPFPFEVPASSFPFTSGEVYTIDKTAPTVIISSEKTSPTTSNLIPVVIAFSEDITGFDINDITVSGGTKSNFSGSGKNYTFDITSSSIGTITVDVAAEVVQDEATNTNNAATQFSIVYNPVIPTVPSVTISSIKSSPTNSNAIPVEITFSENVSGFSIGDIIVNGGAKENFSGSGKIYFVDITPTADGIITVDIPAEVAEGVTNFNTAADQFSITYDGTRPTVTISSTVFGPTESNPIPVKINFSENVTGFDINDITVTGATKSNFAGDGSAYTMNVIPTISGTITVKVAANNAYDVAGNLNIESNQFTIIYSNCMQVIAGEIEGDQTIQIGEGATELISIEAASGGDNNLSYQWEFSVDGVFYSQISGATKASYAPGALSQTTSFRRMAISAGGCGTALSNVITITVVPAELIKGDIPNALFFNGDVGNNTWGISHLGIQKSVRIRVVDNTGRVLFQTNDPNKEWNGMYNGNKVAEDTYHFIIDDLGGKKVEGSIRVYY